MEFLAKKKQAKTAKKAAKSASAANSNVNVINNNTEQQQQQQLCKAKVWPNVLKEDGVKNPTTDLVGSIDQGTSSTRFLVFTSKGRIAASAQMEHAQIFPSGDEKIGWHEHDPLELWNNTRQCIAAVASALLLQQPHNGNLDLQKYPLSSVGITNQRETTICFNKKTGLPYYNAIVWDDTRTTHIAAAIADGNADRLRCKTGLPVASYFAGTKVKWLLDNVIELQRDLHSETTRDQVCFGTVDTWLLYQLTGSSAASNNNNINTGGLFCTDVTNASRWLFMNLETQAWDQELMDIVTAPHVLPITALATIGPSSHVYGKCTGAACGVAALQNVPLAAILGDQQAALFGQTAFSPGEAKNTYGTGMFLMMNTGTEAVQSTHGLLTTVAYQIGNEPVIFALEGSVSHSGSTIQWLRDQLQVIKDAPESETQARRTKHNDGLYFVPAFSGLFAPHWRSDARGCIVGMTATHHKGHICRAALEAAAYQAREVFDAIVADSNCSLQTLNVDGGGTNNNLLMQFQADIIGVPIVKPAVMETTAIGAAFAAGLAVGIWKNTDEIKQLWAVSQTFEPKMAMEDREKYWVGWQKAVSRSLDWVDESDDDKFVDAVSGPPAVSALDEDWVEIVAAQAPEAPAAGYRPVVLVLCTGLALAAGFALGRHRKLQ